MVKLYPQVAGNTLGAHKKFFKKLKRRGAKKTTKIQKSDAIIVFCPIASRYETDVKAALSNLPVKLEKQKVVLVAMHHTFDPNYTLPSCRQLDTDADLLVDCLFYEKKGLLKCERNKSAIKTICKELNIMTPLKQLVKRQ